MQQMQFQTRHTNKFRRDDFEARPWGSWTVLNKGSGYKVKLLEVSPGQRMSLQYHHFRAEHWVVVSGRARVQIGSQAYELGVLQSVMFPEGTIHRIENPYDEPLVIIEVQHGMQLSEKDIVRLEDDYNRVPTEKEIKA